MYSVHNSIQVWSLLAVSTQTSNAWLLHNISSMLLFKLKKNLTVYISVQ